MVTESIESIRRCETVRHKFEEVLRFLSDVVAHADISVEALCDEIRCCASAAAIAGTKLIKAVKLQSEMDGLGDTPIVVCFISGVYFEQKTDRDGCIEHLEVWPEVLSVTFLSP